MGIVILIVEQLVNDHLTNNTFYQVEGLCVICVSACPCATGPVFQALGDFSHTVT